MSIVGKFRKLESKIARTLDAVAERAVRAANAAGNAPRQPIEIVHALLDRVEEQVQTAGRGRRIFPFNVVHVFVVAPDKANRARAAAVFESDPGLQARILSRLREAGCEPGPIRVAVTYALRPQKHWTSPEMHVEFDREEGVAATPEPAPTSAPSRAPAAAIAPRIDLTVASGQAEHKTYSFTGEPLINLGRRGDVLDKKQRFLRVNHVAFTEADSDVNRSVSRKHAHITFDSAASEYRICDDRSAQGTSVIRKGRPASVPPGTRGIKLQNGDEIVLGHARLKVKLSN